jgi:nicotinamide-nucleotide amidase
MILMRRIVNQTYKLLQKTEKTVAVAESCTGGSLSRYLTSQSGSSKYFVLGVVPYSNRMKTRILDIPSKLILQKGAVSKEVAEAMARSVRKLAVADYGIGITGIAGPTGGTPKKPVGTVFIAIANRNKILCKKLHFPGNRSRVREETILKALTLLKRFLKF